MANWFEPLVSEDKLHTQFKWLLNLGYRCEQELLQSWIDDFPVKDGFRKTIKEFQTTFRSTFWELYLNQVFKSSNWEVDPNAVAPDFIINRNGATCSVEAVIANFSINSKPEEERTLNDIYGDNNIYEIIEESIPRTLNAIAYKSKKYFKTYSKNEVVTKNPYVVALGDYGQINYGQSAFYSMMSVLYNAAYDPEDRLDLKILCNDNYGNEYKYIESYEKENGSKLPLGIFSNDENKHISAIIFSCTLTLGKLSSLCPSHTLDKYIYLEREHLKQIRYTDSEPDEHLCDGLFVFLNPYAEHPLDTKFLSGKGLTVVSANFDDFYEINIDCYRSSPLLRRKVGMRGDEFSHLEDLNEFDFYAVKKVT